MSTLIPAVADLQIPPKALTFHDRPHRVLLTDDDVADRIRDVAAPVVAAELRRQADFYDGIVTKRGTSRGVQTGNKAFSLVARQLRSRADELDPQ